ncbi:MAG TPA: patatin-like phospholipase family protein [Thermoanaerobaculia bacterium]|jgi:NTE family protein|nr:patatin-like phospholipase family protein [Thermoanaerobaculia bacterium]
MPNGELPLTSDAGSDEKLEDILALCLSGGGYRAMLFHLGTLWYLNDTGYLPKLDRVSSVSGGSITAGVLATRWKDLTFDATGKATNFGNVVVVPVRKMASTTVDAGSVIKGLLTPGTSVSDKVIKSYRNILFGDATLQDFVDKPRFVINATNVQTGSLFRFSKPYIADWRVGMINNPTTKVAEAVAASSAFPPVLSPARLDFNHGQWSQLNTQQCGRPPFTTKVVLTDGGVYDNMGIETAWKRCKRVLVSDGGGHYQSEENPSGIWVQHSIRITGTIDNQVRSLRKRQILSAFTSEDDPHTGTYWGMWTKPSKYPVPGLPADDAKAEELARVSTRLAELKNDVQNRLINFGYTMAERAIRSHFDPAAFKPTAFPCPGGV